MLNNVMAKNQLVFTFFTFFFVNTFFKTVSSRKGETPLFPLELSFIDKKKVPMEINNNNIIYSKNKKETKTYNNILYLNLFKKIVMVVRKNKNNNKRYTS